MYWLYRNCPLSNGSVGAKHWTRPINIQGESRGDHDASNDSNGSIGHLVGIPNMHP